MPNSFKRELLAVAIETMNGPKIIAQEAERLAKREQLSKDILNYNRVDRGECLPKCCSIWVFHAC